MPAPLPPDREELTIKTGGRILGGWERISVTRGVELCPSHFDIELTERFPGQAGAAIVSDTATCTVALSGDLVLTGYIDRYQPAYDKHQHRVRIIGRSKTEDLIDCSVDAVKTGWDFGANTIGQAAKIVCDPYGIGVSLPDGDAALPDVAKHMWIYPGYTAYALLEELTRSVGMLLWDDANGDLVISKGGTGGRAGSAIVEGQNAERVSAVFAADQRFARYLVLAQGQDQIFSHISSAAEQKDPEASQLRGRLKVIPQEIPDKDLRHFRTSARCRKRTAAGAAGGSSGLRSPAGATARASSGRRTRSSASTCRTLRRGPTAASPR